MAQKKASPAAIHAQSSSVPFKPVDVVKMNCLKRHEKLVRGYERNAPGLLWRERGGESFDMFQAGFHQMRDMSAGFP
jgi:hypothetical protein